MPIPKKPCAPCEDKSIRPLSKERAEEYLKEIDGWKLDADTKTLTRTLELKDFITVIDLVNNIADIAEEEGHHPDLHITSYKKLTIELSTHSIGGLSENDFIIAQRINAILPFAI